MARPRNAVRHPDPDWFAFLQPGDVLEFRGSYRIVRHVTRWHGRLHSVTFAIKRPSWTGRCYTVCDRNDLKTSGARYVGARVKLDTEMDRKIHQSITGREFPPHYTLRARDVVGVVPA